MTWHLIEGEEGCAYARDNGCVAVVVAALRASATAAMLLDAGATEVCVVREVEDAFNAKQAYPTALLVGERNGLPPEGFDCGTSPRDVGGAAGRPVVLMATTGSARLVDAYGAPALYIGTTVNALGVVGASVAHDKDVVLIPAGCLSEPDLDSQEDWAAAVAIAMLADAAVGEGALRYRDWRHRIELDGLPKLFETAPHADHLREIGCSEDIRFCARLNVTGAVPHAVRKNEHGVVLRTAP